MEIMPRINSANSPGHRPEFGNDGWCGGRLADGSRLQQGVIADGAVRYV
jgi:hypothetical protein